MRATYLTGEHVYLRGLREADKERAVAWFPSVFPINATRAEQFFRELSDHPWGAQNHTLVIVRSETDEIVGSIELRSWDSRTCQLQFHFAPALPDADVVWAETLRLVIPWLRDEHEMMTVDVSIPADAGIVVETAEDLGMVLGARLREHIARPAGRVDALIYQALNPRWEVPDA